MPRASHSPGATTPGIIAKPTILRRVSLAFGRSQPDKTCGHIGWNLNPFQHLSNASGGLEFVHETRRHFLLEGMVPSRVDAHSHEREPRTRSRSRSSRALFPANAGRAEAD